jgi:hypothetical protein
VEAPKPLRPADTGKASEPVKPKEAAKPETEIPKLAPVPAAKSKPAAATEPVKPEAAQPPAVETGKGKPAEPAKVAPADAAGKATADKSAEQPAEKPPAKSAPEKQPAKAEPAAAATSKPPATREAASATAAKQDVVPKVEPALSADDAMPNFGAVVNTSVFGSLKIKLGIAAVVAVICGVAYFGMAGKPTKAPANVSTSADGVGPSIMVGEGGWVESWGGDPIGQHGGRQITMYRPSLKLSDYRIEFQGQIESKSIGWVFRASDPENYYAMKLMLVSQELPLTVALYKYIVLKGRQIQVGRVPIDVPVKNDTVFKIRVDVRGPKFNTFVQDQPVDVWTDDQLRSGGVGFLNERVERGRVKSVSLSYLTGGTK